MILKIQQKEYNIPITEEDQPDLANIPAFYQKNNGNFWIGLDDNMVVGSIALKNIGDKKAVLRKMFVMQEYRGKEWGVAKGLLLNLLDWARQHHFKEIYLGTTPQFLAAHRFYEKNGFREISQKSLPSNFPVMEVDKKFYCYEL
ncbi:GNAT family N-acetyltransferase [Desulfosporosinus sp. FKA]|uniref:GNAT family N-acetyltransferase n=1 Tax=Desulfosporosinus sp. FKA TaxID=1969834 RepID=UPI001A9A37E7|nr:GNAT family N-acetyltransferase [Desulfosporosinus sp. FKA]